MMRSTNDDAILDYIPKWGRIWIVISSLLVICDFCYVLCHPHSFPDGKWGSYLPFTLWHNYAKWDLRYANPNDTFNYVQSLLNVLEMILGLYLSFPPPISTTTTTTTTKALNSSSSSSSSKVRQAQMLVVVEICTCYKTIIYFGMVIISGFEYSKHNHPMMIVLVALFSLPWIVVPAILAKTIMDRLLVFMMNNNNNNNIPSSSSSSPPFGSEEGKKKE